MAAQCSDELNGPLFSACCKTKGKMLLLLQNTVQNIGKHLVERVHQDSNTRVEMYGRHMKGTCFYSFLLSPCMHSEELTQHVYLCNVAGSSWRCWFLLDTLPPWWSIIHITLLALTISVRLPPTPAPFPLQDCSFPAHSSASSSKELSSEASDSVDSVTMRLLVPLKCLGQTLLSLKSGVLCLNSVKAALKPAAWSRDSNPPDQGGRKREGLRYMPASSLKPQMLMLSRFPQQVILQTWKLCKCLKRGDAGSFFPVD